MGKASPTLLPRSAAVPAAGSGTVPVRVGRSGLTVAALARMGSVMNLKTRDWRRDAAVTRILRRQGYGGQGRDARATLYV